MKQSAVAQATSRLNDSFPDFRPAVSDPMLTFKFE